MNDNLKRQLPNVSLSDATPMLCAKCNGRNFMEVVRFYRFSALLTGNPKDSVFPLNVYLCGNCGETLQELLPNELKDKTNDVKLDK